LLHVLCIFLGASVVFAFSFHFVLFAAINGLITSYCFGGRWTPFFIAKNTLVFTLIVQRVISFSATTFSFWFFALIFVQILFYICIKVYLDLWSMLFFIKKSCFKKVRMMLEKRKSFMQKVVQKGACVDCGLGFCMSCLMSSW
jgi:hypothetical protein